MAKRLKELNLEERQNLIEKLVNDFARGLRTTELAKKYNLDRTTITRILGKNRNRTITIELSKTNLDSLQEITNAIMACRQPQRKTVTKTKFKGKAEDGKVTETLVIEIVEPPSYQALAALIAVREKLLENADAKTREEFSLTIMPYPDADTDTKNLLPSAEL